MSYKDLVSYVEEENILEGSEFDDKQEKKITH